MFLRILVFSKPFQSLVLQANMCLKTKFNKDLHFGLILDPFWDRQSIEIGFKIKQTMSLDATSFSRPFLGALGASWVEITTPKWPDVGGG